jgi:hypothetical protein
VEPRETAKEASLLGSMAYNVIAAGKALMAKRREWEEYARGHSIEIAAGREAVLQSPAARPSDASQNTETKC